MAANWKDYLFDNDGAQRDDIEALRLNSELDSDTIDQLRTELQRTRERLDRTELVVETLFMTLENQGLVNPETFGTLLREVDGLDGRVDGKAAVKPSEG